MHLHCNSEDGPFLQTKLKGTETIQEAICHYLKVLIRVIIFKVIVINWKMEASGYPLGVNLEIYSAEILSFNFKNYIYFLLMILLSTVLP